MKRPRLARQRPRRPQPPALHPRLNPRCLALDRLRDDLCRSLARAVLSRRRTRVAALVRVGVRAAGDECARGLDCTAGARRGCGRRVPPRAWCCAWCCIGACARGMRVQLAERDSRRSRGAPPSPSLLTPRPLLVLLRDGALRAAQRLVKAPRVLIVDLVPADLERARRRPGPHAQQEAKVRVSEAGLERADDGARVAEEGRWGDVGWARVAG